MNEDTPEVEVDLDWQKLDTDPEAPDYVDLETEEAPDFASPAAQEKTVPYPMSRRVKEGSGGALVIEFDLPGVRASEIAVTIVGSEVTVQACRPDVAEAESSTFTVPHYDLENAAAWTEDGVLRVRIPKAPEVTREVFVKTLS